MDSEDEFMSDPLSGDEVDFDEGTQDSDIGSLGGDFDQDDGGFGYEKDIVSNPHKPYEVDHKILSPQDIQAQQERQFKEVSSIIELPPEQAAILLRYMRWNKEKLIESYMDDPEQVLEAAGLGATFAQSPKTEVVKGFTCEICYEDDPKMETWYKCNRFEEKSGADARDAQARSRHSLERYLHYYNRYANHEQSAKLDKDLWAKTEKKMTSLQTQSNMSWIEVQFLDTAAKALQACRQTLKWTYAFAYYLERNNMTEIFEDNQKDLEMAVENLSQMFEKPVNELGSLKVEILDKTTYCNRRREILLSDTAENLMKDQWKFIVDL
ncbi:hypothetical protein KCU88_g1193, partial [Aureobasidium melanogenum]